MQTPEEFAEDFREWMVANAQWPMLGDRNATKKLEQIIAARDAEWQARVDRLKAALRYLYDSGPTPEGFRNLDKDCYEYAIDMLNPGEDELPDKDPRWFDGWLRMIEESAARAAIIGEEE